LRSTSCKTSHFWDIDLRINDWGNKPSDEKMAEFLIGKQHYGWKTPHGQSASQSLVSAKQHLCLCADGADVIINHADMPAAYLGFKDSLFSPSEWVRGSKLKENQVYEKLLFCF
jgi:hypothetical protein